MFLQFRVLKTLMLIRVLSRYFIEIFLSRSAENLRRGTLLCFTIFRVSKKFRITRGQEEEYHDFFSVKNSVAQFQKYS